MERQSPTPHSTASQPLTDADFDCMAMIHNFGLRKASQGGYVEKVPNRPGEHRLTEAEKKRRLLAAQRLRERLLHIAWYAKRDREDGIKYWLGLHASQVLSD